MGRAFSQDLSSFMCIILMLIGILIILLIANVVVIISNPENIRITSIIANAAPWEEGGPDDTISGMPFPFGNKFKEPSYIDVYRDYVVLYPGEDVVSVRDMEHTGNAFERMLARVDENKAEEYIVLLARPGSATVVHRLKKVIKDRGIDIGCELFEANRPTEYDRAAKASGRPTVQPKAQTPVTEDKGDGES